MNLPIDSATKTPADQLAAMSAEQQRELLRQLLSRQAEAARNFALSAGQQGLWYAFRRDPLSTAFNVFLPSRIVSPLRVEALHKAIDFLVDRHLSLRTTFTDADGELRQRVNDSRPPEFTVIDACGFDDAELDRQVLAQTQRPFDLESGPLMRMAVFRRSDDDHIVVATTHHIVVDFWSLILLLNELREVYQSFAAGKQPRLPPASGNYASFVAEQQAIIDGPTGQSLREHWHQTLDGAPHVLNWFTDCQRPKTFTGRADVVPLRLSDNILPSVKRIAAEQSTTTTAVVIAALQVFIARYTRENDFLIGSPFAGRSHRKYEETVGFFVNMLPLRADLSDEPTFTELVRRVGKTLLTSLEHENLPLAEIVRLVQPPRDSSRSPLFQVTCTFEKSHIREEAGRAGFLIPDEQEAADIGGMLQESFYVPHPTCHHDIEFIFEQTDRLLRGMICYCRDLFDKTTAEQMAANFGNLIESLVLSPEVSVCQTPWRRVPRKADPMRFDRGTETLVCQLEESFQRTPDAIAMMRHGRSITFHELNQATQSIANHLRARGIGRGDIVPVAAKQAPRTLIALIGVIRCGAAVVPIDTDQPAVTADDLFEDTQAKLVLIDQPGMWSESLSLLDRNIAVMTIENMLKDTDESPSCDREILPNDLAYVIYTSGSTGRPKGVMIEQHAIANTVRWRAEHVALNETDRVLMLLSHQFDAGFGIAVSTLAQGEALVWPDDRSTVDLDATVDQINRDRLTVLPAVPSLLHLFANHPHMKGCESIRQIWSGGESMPPDLPEQLKAVSNARIWNFYGPTEAAVEAAACEVTDHDPKRSIPIGKPISNTDILVLDDAGHLVPDTVPGQLAIRGRGLARGYLNDQAQTDTCFIPTAGDPTKSSRMYLTGDLGRRRTDGSLEFLGRIDQQVKVRGYRIELEEIENVLRRHPAVENAAVKVINPHRSAAYLAAFVLLARPDDENILTAHIQRYLADHLAAYKRPGVICIVDELPINAGGKIIRSRLPDHVDLDQDPMSIVSPSTKFEQHLADRWCEMLQIEDIGINQNFFELGGSSLQAAMMTAKLTEDLGVHVPTALVFDLADISTVARRLVDLHRPVIESRFDIESVEAYHDPTILDNDDSQSLSTNGDIHPLIATFQHHGTVKHNHRYPMFMIHPPGGIVNCYRELSRQIETDLQLFAIRSRGLHGNESLPKTLEAMASDYADAIHHVQPSGPYIVGGWSLGGVIAYEVAQQLLARGESIQRLILLDSTIPAGASDSIAPDESDRVGLEYGIDLTLDELSELDEHDQLPFLWQHAVNLGVIDETSDQNVVQQILNDLKHSFHHHVKLTSRYRIRPIAAPTLLIRPTDVPVKIETSRDRDWGQIISEVDVRFISGHHHSMVQQPHVDELAKAILASL